MILLTNISLFSFLLHSPRLTVLQPSLMVLKHAQHIPALGPLYLLFLLPEAIFANIYTIHSFTSSGSLLKGHLTRDPSLSFFLRF